jgi:signal transduction histidine kinase
MTDVADILFVHSNISDCTLTAWVLQHEMPDAAVKPIPDALALADALAAGTPGVVIIAADLAWAHVGQLIETIRRRAPAAAILLFGNIPDIDRVLESSLSCDGLVRKNSAGFLALPTLSSELLRHTRRGDGGEAPAREAPAREAPARETPAREATADTAEGEMREIALVFSHDLKEPMQQIARLVRRAQNRSGPETGTDALTHALEYAERASSMLDKMIEYFSVIGREAPRRPIDLNQCLNHALKNLQGIIDESRAEVRAQPLPVILGDEYQLTHLFQNLVSNAIKFRGRERPSLTIGARERGEHWHLTFRDNGIGIPQAFAERIFAFGKRLHLREEYAGAGIGLALSRLIVERHGGRIWAEPHGDEPGTTFHLRLPRLPAEPTAAPPVHAEPRENARRES